MPYDWMHAISKKMMEISELVPKKDVEKILSETKRIYETEYRNIGYEYDILKKEKDRLQREVDKKYRRGVKDFQIWISLLSGIVGNLAANYYKNYNGKIESSNDVLIRLFGRQLHICNEIGTLLENGFADAAQARWRTLYEIYVFMTFISEYGNETAEMYKDFEDIERYWLATYLNKRIESIDEINTIKIRYEQLIKKYGEDYASNLGWTKSVFRNPKDRTIEKIAKSAKSLEPFYHLAYKVASENIHGNMFGNNYKLAKAEPSSRIIIEGESEGIGEPLVYSIDVMFKSMIEVFKIAADEYEKIMFFFLSVMSNEIKTRIIEGKES